MIRLYTERGVTELQASQIASFELDEHVAPRPAPAPAPAAEPAPQPSPAELLEQAARRNGLRPEFVRSVASAESALNPTAVSPKGAIGLMQLMPGTAAELGVDPKDPAQNADGGARYLRGLLEKYKGDPDGVRLALAAYNAGPGAVEKHGGSIPPYRETRQYVDRVVGKYLNEIKR
ncbi:MAG: lytic transglycosylase domain-containing protein [Acidobacteria bacterium]|nr:lytic transglycosylase domain-containing protein [Acidobacteriota bacterium]MBI3281972.1 lytic transglycosylase domain-containing protein [Acidobacteriota bacterium]